MYGKIFDSIYDGTLYGKWEALVTFQQFIVLCDADGMVDMTPMALSARTGIPREIIDKGIEILEAPDPYTRTPGSNGVRIERIDDHRPWGWHIVNHEKYKRLQDADTVRAQTRERVRKCRENKKKSKDAQDVTVGNGRKRHTDTDTNTDTSKKKKKEKESGFALPEWVDKESWQEFEQHRKELKKPLTDLARTKNLNVLSAHRGSQSEIVSATIANGWAGLFPPKQTKKSGNGAHSESQILAAAKARGIEPRPGESWESVRQRVAQAR